MVSAFATSNGVVIGQVKTANKSNEITAIPELLELLDIKGCLVSIDAMGCQKEIAEKIVNQGGDYFLAVKGNQETLYKAVKEHLSVTVSASNTPDDLPVERKHGRLEIREYHVMGADDVAKQHPEWKGLKSIGVAVGMRLEKSGKVSLEYRYYISSAALTQERFAQAVRRHWGIENQLHWVLDVTMKEDNCQIFKDNSAENLAVMRHAALNMLRNEKSEKKSVRRKQRKAHVNTEYLELVLSTEFKSVEK
jgi:predicted transposase YbfD/YdcC